ncbi:MAG: hypothetical protein MI739_03195 [Bacteroidales bacterium]|nr:hypothetical protein [Bacteroidales bacterium]
MIINKIRLGLEVIRYNLKIVFANKFIYFLIAAIAFFLLITGIFLFNNGTVIDAYVYNLLIFPGILIMFYPVIFNIQNDKDARMLEIIFGVPNYRYKVYLVRFTIAMLLLFVILYLMGWFVVFAILRIDVLPMVGQLMFPLLFLASVAFLFSTLLRNANGAAVIMIVIGLVFFILNQPLRYSKWNLFFNPFDVANDMSYSIWRSLLYQNRLMLSVASIVAILWALINLQRREKFV